MSTLKVFPLYNVIRWPNSTGDWWLVSESSETSGYTPIRQLHPTGNKTAPTYNNQLWRAAELLANKGLAALNNPHGMIGAECGCDTCFCCAAAEIVKAAALFMAFRPTMGHKKAGQK